MPFLSLTLGWLYGVWYSRGWCNEMTGVKVGNKVKFKVNRNIRYTPSPLP